MPRAVWRGSISFGMVTIPVRLYAAVRRRDVRFREVDRSTGRRIRHQRVVDAPSAHGEESILSRPGEPNQLGGAASSDEPARVEPRATPSEPPVPRQVLPSDLVRGYEVSPGRMVEITEEDLSPLAPERTRTIDVELFVSRKELDPIYFESWYYVVPDTDRVRPFALMLRAMQQTNRAAICWVVLRSRRHLAALQPRGRFMLMSTLLFADEIIPTRDVEPILPSDLSEREIEMAELLVDTLTGPFEPQRYRDEYREKVLALIESRAGSVRVVKEPELPAAPRGIDELMAALKASVEQAKARRQPGAEPAKRRTAVRRPRR